jgi:ATP-dependent DNA ligase
VRTVLLSISPPLTQPEPAGADLYSLFVRALEEQEEGLILKRIDSQYVPGKRVRSGWFKVCAVACAF